MMSTVRIIASYEINEIFVVPLTLFGLYLNFVIEPV